MNRGVDTRRVEFENYDVLRRADVMRDADKLQDAAEKHGVKLRFVFP